MRLRRYTKGFRTQSQQWHAVPADSKLGRPYSTERGGASPALAEPRAHGFIMLAASALDFALFASVTAGKPHCEQAFPRTASGLQAKSHYYFWCACKAMWCAQRRTCAAQRVTQRHGAAVGVDNLRVQAQLLDAVCCLRGGTTGQSAAAAFNGKQPAYKSLEGEQELATDLSQKEKGSGKPVVASLNSNWSPPVCMDPCKQNGHASRSMRSKCTHTRQQARPGGSRQCTRAARYRGFLLILIPKSLP